MKASYPHLEFRLPPSEANNEAPRPEIHSNYSAAEAPCRPRFAPLATPPPPGASPPPRSRWQLQCAMDCSLGQPMRQRHCSLKWRKSHNRNPLGSNEVLQTVTDRRGNAQSHRLCIRASTPNKLGTKLLESMFVLQGLFQSLHV